jgi:WD40 repeat protein
MPGDKLKLFISYSRRDMAAADLLVTALEGQDFEVTIDRRNLPYGEEWQKELGDFIRGADTVVWLVSPDSVASKWCNWELGEVGRLHKRLVTVKIRPVALEELPESLGKINLLPAEGVYDPAAHLALLVTTLNTDGAWTKESTRLADRAREWIAGKRNPGLLLRGAGLKNAEAWSTIHPRSAPPPASDVLELILSSRRGAARRQRWTIGGSFAVAAVALTLAGIAWIQRQDSQSREFAALATNQLGIDPVDSVRLARSAVDVAPTPQAVEALRRALFGSHIRMMIPPAPPTPSDAGAGPDRKSLSALDRKGDVIATARGPDIELWSVADGHPLRSFHAGLQPAFIAFEGGDGTLAITGEDGSRQVWHIDAEPNGQSLRPAPLSAPPRPEGTAVDRDALVSVADDGSITITSLATGKARRVPPIQPPIEDKSEVLAISPDGKWLMVRSISLGDFDPVLVDANTGQVKRQFKGHEDKVSKATFSPDSQVVATITEWTRQESGGGPAPAIDTAVRLWEVASEEGPKELRGHTREVRDVAFSPNGNLVVTASVDETARVWDAHTKRELTILRGHQSPVQSARFSSDGSSILTTAEDGGVRLWEAVTGREVSLKAGGDVRSDKAVFSADAGQVLTVDEFHNVVSVYDSHSGNLVKRITDEQAGLSKASFSPDGNDLLIIGRGEIHELPIKGDGVVRRMLVPNDCCERAMMSPDGRTLALTNGWANDASGGNARLVLDFGGSNEIKALVPRQATYETAVFRASFNRDGRLLVTAGMEFDAVLYEVANGNPLRQLSAGPRGHKDWLLQAIFGPGDTVLTASRDGSAILWDAQGNFLRIFRGHDGAVGGSAFSPDGVLVATASADATVRIWDSGTGTSLTVLGGMGEISDVAFSPDGRELLTVSSDGIVCIYPLPAYGAINDMKEMACRNLNSPECTRERDRKSSYIRW